MRDNEQRRPEAEADGIIEGRNADRGPAGRNDHG